MNRYNFDYKGYQVEVKIANDRLTDYLVTDRIGYFVGRFSLIKGVTSHLQDEFLDSSIELYNRDRRLRGLLA